MNNTSWIWKKHIIALLVYDITQSQGTSWVVFVRFGGDLREARAPSLFAVATCIIHYIHAKTHSHSRSFTFTCICGFHNCTKSGRAKWEGGRGEYYIIAYYGNWVRWFVGTFIAPWRRVSRFCHAMHVLGVVGVIRSAWTSDIMTK